MPTAPVTPHWEDVLPAISLQPALQQCRDALTKHKDVKYRNSGPPSLWSARLTPLSLANATLTEMWTFGHSLRTKCGDRQRLSSAPHCLPALSHAYRAGLPCHWHYVTDTTPVNREDLRRPLCSVVDQRSRLWLPLSAVVPDAWLCVKRSSECAPCYRTVAPQKQAPKLPPSGHGGYRLRKPRFLQAAADLNPYALTNRGGKSLHITSK